MLDQQVNPQMLFDWKKFRWLKRQAGRRNKAVHPSATPVYLKLIASGHRGLQPGPRFYSTVCTAGRCFIRSNHAESFGNAALGSTP